MQSKAKLFSYNFCTDFSCHMAWFERIKAKVLALQQLRPIRVECTGHNCYCACQRSLPGCLNIYHFKKGESGKRSGDQMCRTWYVMTCMDQVDSSGGQLFVQQRNYCIFRSWRHSIICGSRHNVTAMTYVFQHDIMQLHSLPLR